MATQFVEGFDDYGPALAYRSAVTYLNYGGWTASYYATPTIAASLNGQGGYAVNMGAVSAGGGSYLYRTLKASLGRIIGGYRFSADLGSDTGIALVDGSTDQVYVYSKGVSGLFSVVNANGTVLGTSTISVAQNTTHYLEFDITIASAGSYQLWLDGVSILSGVGNTQRTLNASANVFALRLTPGGSCTYDDLYVFDTSTGYCSTPCLTNPTVLTQFPIADSSVSFTPVGNIIGTYVTQGTTPYMTVDANTLLLINITANTNCSMNALQFLMSSEQGGNPIVNVTACVYADNSGRPGSLIAQGALVGIVGGAVNTVPLSTALSLTGADVYWIGILSDTSMYLQADGVSSNACQAHENWSSGPPSTAPTMTFGVSTPVMYAECTGANHNWVSEILNPAIGDESSVTSSTVGAEDLYVFPALPSNIQEVYTVSVVGNARVTYPGFREIDLLANSGGTTGSGSNPNISPTTSYTSYNSNFDVDPNTSAQWTPTAVTNGTFGMSIAV